MNTEKELVKAAYEAQKYSYSPYSGFEVGAALLGKMEKFIWDATLKTQRILQATVQSGQHFLKRSLRGVRNLKRLLLWEIKKERREISVRRAGCAVK